MDVTLEDVLSVDSPRPDLRQFQIMARSGTSPSIVTAWEEYFRQGPAFQVPLEIPWERSFVFSYSEVEYVDRAARFLFGTVDPSDTEIPLPSVKSLYTYPVPGSEGLRPEVTKAVTGLMRLTGRVLWPSDWLVHRRSGSHVSRVTPSSELAIGLTKIDFAELPPVAR